jgi:hypothetical protein
VSKRVASKYAKWSLRLPEATKQVCPLRPVARATSYADVIRNADSRPFPVAHQNFTISVELARVESVHFTYRFDDGSSNFQGF